MDDAFLVRGLQRVANLAGNCQSFLQRQGALFDAVGERLSFYY